MAAEKITVSNITPTLKDITSLTRGKSYEENGAEPVLTAYGPTQNWKINEDYDNKFSVLEIFPPYVKRVQNENSMIIDCVDSNMVTSLIEFEDGSRIEALKLTPNPNSLVISSAKIINRYNTMTRWVEEHWGDELDTINFAGSTYSFNARLDNNNYTGLTSLSRNYSEAYKFLKALVDIYRTNGYLYQEGNGYTAATSRGGGKDSFDYAMVNRYLLQNPSFLNQHPRQGMIRERLYTRISFDYVTCIGYFESFDITDDSSSPFKLLYSAVFKSEKTIWKVGV